MSRTRRPAAVTTDARGASTTSHVDIRWLPRSPAPEHMTVLRGEDVQSRVASWDRCPYRIASSPRLAIVPLIIRRLRSPAPNRIMPPCVDSRSVARCCLLRRRCDRLQGCPQEARELRAIATTTFGAGLCSATSDCGSTGGVGADGADPDRGLRRRQRLERHVRVRSACYITNVEAGERSADCACSARASI